MSPFTISSPSAAGDPDSLLLTSQVFIFLSFCFVCFVCFVLTSLLQTCFFTLYLPAYSTKERMKEALQISLQCLDIDRDVNV